MPVCWLGKSPGILKNPPTLQKVGILSKILQHKPIGLKRGVKRQSNKCSNLDRFFEQVFDYGMGFHNSENWSRHAQKKSLHNVAK